MIPKNDKFHKRIGNLPVFKSEAEKEAFESFLSTEMNSPFPIGKLVSGQKIKMIYKDVFYEFDSDEINNVIKMRHRNED